MGRPQPRNFSAQIVADVEAAIDADLPADVLSWHGVFGCCFLMEAAGRTSETSSRITVAEAFIGTYSGGIAKLNFAQNILPGEKFASVDSEKHQQCSLSSENSPITVIKAFGSVVLSASVRKVAVYSAADAGEAAVFAAFGASNGEVAFLDVSRSVLLETFDSQTECVNDLAFVRLHDRTFLLAAGGKTRGKLAVWLCTGQPFRKWFLKKTLSLGKWPITHIVMTRNKAQFFTLDERPQLTLWSLEKLLESKRNRGCRPRNTSNGRESIKSLAFPELRFRLGFRPESVEWCPESAVFFFAGRSILEMYDLNSGTAVSSEKLTDALISCVYFVREYGANSGNRYAFLGTSRGEVLLIQCISNSDGESSFKVIDRLAVESAEERCRPGKIRDIGLISISESALDIVALTSFRLFSCRFFPLKEEKAFVDSVTDFGHRITCSYLHRLSKNKHHC
jgi:hypothetical protein